MVTSNFYMFSSQIIVHISNVMKCEFVMNRFLVIRQNFKLIRILPISGLHEQPRLEILTPEAYDLRCVQMHRNIKLNGFELGNMHNFGLFMSHYLLDMTEPMPNQTNMLRKGEMDFLLEHDCKKMMIRFTLAEFSAQRFV